MATAAMRLLRPARLAAGRASGASARRWLSTAPAASTDGEQSFADGHFSIKDEKYDGRAIYLDTQATTPLDPRVMDTMMPHMTSMYGNPHSRTHVFGWEAEEATEVARKQVADLVGADAKEIIFTSGELKLLFCDVVMPICGNFDQIARDYRRDRVDQRLHQGHRTLLQEARQDP